MKALVFIVFLLFVGQAAAATLTIEGKVLPLTQLTISDIIVATTHDVSNVGLADLFYFGRITSILVDNDTHLMNYTVVMTGLEFGLNKTPYQIMNLTPQGDPVFLDRPVTTGTAIPPPNKASGETPNKTATPPSEKTPPPGRTPPGKTEAPPEKKVSIWARVKGFFGGLIGAKPKVNETKIVPPPPPKNASETKIVPPPANNTPTISVPPPEFTLSAVGDFYASSSSEKFTEFDSELDWYDPEVTIPDLYEQYFDATTWKSIPITVSTQSHYPLRRVEYWFHDDERDRYWDGTKRTWSSRTVVVRVTPSNQKLKKITYELIVPTREMQPGSYELCTLGLGNEGAWSPNDCVSMTFEN